ncbi:hypothetical protein LIER_00827 [Lithospermum erythrorhizon]|uniref:Uncharacterized protein n=1 Tax=Lithospermum erythrorhizon TaxID=34254 RepID=A0AAV3NIU6_LITER
MFFYLHSYNISYFASLYKFFDSDTREVNVISGLPAATSTERLDVLDDERHVTGFSVIGGEHRLRNYKSMTTVHEVESEGRKWTIILESYIVDVPEGNSDEDTMLFADTVVRLNLQKLASVSQTKAPFRHHPPAH